MQVETAIPEDDFAALKQRVWERSRDQIEKAVESGLIEELRAGMRSDLKRLIHAEVRAIIKPKIEAKRREIEVRLDQLVDRMAEISSTVIEQEFVVMLEKTSESLISRVQEIQHDLTGRFSRRLQQRLNESFQKLKESSSKEIPPGG
jgi:DNA anti-recombination protein RmuC